MSLNETTQQFEIIDLAFGGNGFARTEQGKAAFVKGALPNETVLAKINKQHKDFLEAETIEVIISSKDRVQPKCPLYERCGGCGLMHLDHKAQVKAKTQWVEKAMTRLGDMPGIEVLTTENPWAYRNRVRFQIKQGKVGFYAFRTKELVQINNCPVAFDSINEILPDLNDLLSEYAGLPMESIELIAGFDQEIFAFLVFSKNQAIAPKKLETLRANLLELGISGVRFAPKGMPEPWRFSEQNGVVYYEQNDLTMWAFPGLFSQVNFNSNKMLISEVLKQAGEGKGKKVLDLYAGTGNFSLPLLSKGFEVTAVENAYWANDAAYFTAEKNNFLRGFVAEQAKTEDALYELNKLKRKYDLIVLDPPRRGAKGLMTQLIGLDPQKVIYISCHPAALARDAKELLGQGYKASALFSADHFPHTGHVEAICVFDRT